MAAGVECYNALRFQGKPVILLSYEGEDTRPEPVREPARRLLEPDQAIRTHHHLKGAPAPEWMVKGVPFLKKRKPTGEAAQPVQLMGGGAGLGTPDARPAVGAGGAGAGQSAGRAAEPVAAHSLVE